MKNSLVKTFVCMILVASAVHCARAESVDDLFFSAYRNCKAGVAFEEEGQPAKALQSFREAERTLLQIMREEPKWQPAIVEYRLRTAQTGISRLAPQIAESMDFSNPPQPTPRIGQGRRVPLSDILPPFGSSSENELQLPQFPETANTLPRNPIYNNELPAFMRLPTAPRTGDETTNDSLKILTDLYQNFLVIQKENQELKNEVKRLTEKVRFVTADGDRSRVRVAELTAQVTQNEARIAELLKNDPAVLQAQHQKEIEQFAQRLDKSETDAATLRTETTTLRNELADLTKKLDTSETTRRTLIEERTTRDTRIAELEKTIKETPDSKVAMAENDVLRGIIIRQMREQADRDRAARALEKELGSTVTPVIREHITELTKPVLEILPEERTLFKDNIALRDLPKAQIIQEFTIRKDSTTTVPETVLTDVQRARELYEAKEFVEAETVYRDLVEKQPDSYLMLVNLGTVQIEAAKPEVAESTLRKAVTVAPEDDSFAYTLLGMALNRQSRYADAKVELVRAVQINKEDAPAHNQLGICYAQEGQSATAEAHFKKAIEINPSYAEAHLNLAVLYATGKAPALDLAKQHYKSARDLGASPDAEIEKLIQ